MQIERLEGEYGIERANALKKIAHDLEVPLEHVISILLERFSEELVCDAKVKGLDPVV